MRKLHILSYDIGGCSLRASSDGIEIDEQGTGASSTSPKTTFITTRANIIYQRLQDSPLAAKPILDGNLAEKIVGTLN